MDEIRDFLTLRQISSLLQDSSRIEQLIFDEDKRLRFLEKQQQDRIDELNETLSNLHQARDEYYNIENRLKDRLNSELQNKLENQGFDLLVKIEQLELQQKDSNEYLEGFKKSYQEIKTEVKALIDTYRNQIQNNQSRIDLLLSEIDPNTHTIFLRAFKKHPQITFTHVHQNQCKVCRMHLNLQIQSDIDTKFQVKLCPGCERLFLPYKVIYG